MAMMNVRYVGLADERTITKAQLKAVGVDYEGPALRWDRSNRFNVKDVPVDDALEEVLRGEGHFNLEAAADDGGLRLEHQAEDPEAEGDVIVDATSGAKSPTKASKARGTS